MRWNVGWRDGYGMDYGSKEEVFEIFLGGSFEAVNY